MKILLKSIKIGLEIRNLKDGLLLKELEGKMNKKKFISNTNKNKINLRELFLAEKIQYSRKNSRKVSFGKIYG